MATLKNGAGVLVDETHGHVFVAQSNGGLLVTDLEGVALETIAMPGRQSSLSMSEDGSSIFLLAHDEFGTDWTSGSTILRVDTTTLAVSPVADAAFDDGCTFRQVVQAAGRLWFATLCPGEGFDGQFGYVDPADGAIVELGWPADYYEIDGILPVPGRPDRLVIVSGDEVDLLEVSDGDPAAISQIADAPHQAYTGVALAADGSEIVVGLAYGIVRYSTEDLSHLGGFGIGAEVTSVALHDDGTLVLGTSGQPDLRAYRAGETKPFRIYDLDRRSGSGVVRHGLVWGTDRLYAIVGGDQLFAFRPRLRAHPDLSLERRHYRYGAEIPISVSLVGPTESRTVAVWSVDRHGVRRKVSEGVVPAGRPLRTSSIARRNVQFEVTFAGDSAYDPTSALTPDVVVDARVVTAMRSGRSANGVRIHRLRELAAIGGKVLPTHAGDCVVFDVDVLVSGRWRDALARCVRLGPTSAARLALKGAREIVGFKYRVRGVFGGDRDNGPASGRWHYFKFVR